MRRGVTPRSWTPALREPPLDLARLREPAEALDLADERRELAHDALPFRRLTAERGERFLALDRVLGRFGIDI